MCLVAANAVQLNHIHSFQVAERNVATTPPSTQMELCASCINEILTHSLLLK